MVLGNVQVTGYRLQVRPYIAGCLPFVADLKWAHFNLSTTRCSLHAHRCSYKAATKLNLCVTIQGTCIITNRTTMQAYNACRLFLSVQLQQRMP